MGKSKFPGKPSKLAGKKKIRILSPTSEKTISTSHQNQQQNGAINAAAAASANAAPNNNVSNNTQNSPNFLEQVTK